MSVDSNFRKLIKFLVLSFSVRKVLLHFIDSIMIIKINAIAFKYIYHIFRHVLEFEVIHHLHSSLMASVDNVKTLVHKLFIFRAYHIKLSSSILISNQTFA